MGAHAIEQKRYLAPDGVRLAADVGGAKRSPAVILMHGGGQTRHSWSGAMRALIDGGYHVINYDARGHGDSDWSRAGDYMLDDRVGDLRAITESLDTPFALVGASLGGATAIHAVALGIKPEAVVLVDMVPHPEPDGIDRIARFMRGNPQGFASLAEAVDVVAAYNPERPRPPDPGGLMRNLRPRSDGRLYWHWDPQILAAEPGVHRQTVLASAERMARSPDLPVLLVRGLHSDVVSDAGVSAFRSMIPGLLVADVAGAGHMVAGDRNDAFNAAVIAFLASVIPSVARGGEP